MREMWLQRRRGGGDVPSEGERGEMSGVRETEGKRGGEMILFKVGEIFFG